jgi:hypothetical protein
MIPISDPSPTHLRPISDPSPTRGRSLQLRGSNVPVPPQGKTRSQGYFLTEQVIILIGGSPRGGSRLAGFPAEFSGARRGHIPTINRIMDACKGGSIFVPLLTDLQRPHPPADIEPADLCQMSAQSAQSAQARTQHTAHNTQHTTHSTYAEVEAVVLAESTSRQSLNAQTQN